MPLNETQNFNENQLELIQSGSSLYTFPSNAGDKINLNIFDGDSVAHRNELESQIYVDESNTIPGNFEYITDINNNVRIKPNDILDNLGYATGNYSIDLNFTRDFWFDLIPDLSTEIEAKPLFFISQISPSRKEIRLLSRQLNVDFLPTGDKFGTGETPIFDDYPFTSTFQNSFKDILGTLDNNDGYDRYDFKYNINFGRGRFLVVNNYAFDNISDTDFSSLIIRLNNPIPNDVFVNDFITLEKELINTQFFSLFYKSEITSVVVGDGLVPDTSITLDDVNNQDDEYQNYEQLINSQNISFQNILTEITSSDKNLNIDFTEFKNHTFFGSAESKLKNFKTKIGNLQNNLREISASLGLDSAVSMSGDKTYIKQRRKSLFNNVNDIITSFTPYEKFLYYDAQNSSTSSAPGIGSNLANTVPVTNSNNELITLSSSYDGFGTVYKHKSMDDAHVDLFTNSYFAQKAPFFNYSGSVYLSFIIKGDEHIEGNPGAGKLSWINANVAAHGNNVKLPEGAFHQKRILNPTITGSKWQQVIFEASQSHWQPINGHLIDDEENFDFTNSGAGVYWQLLSGSNITGSGAIEAPDGYDTYPDQFSSDFQFTGSIMPMGELFRIHYKNTIEDNTTEATSSFITDVKVTLKDPQYAYPFDYTYKTGSTQWSNWYDTTLSSSVEFDNSNIHSLKNNLPDYILRDNSFDELYTFVSMIGEHFDLIRNYIDNYNNLTKRNYTQLNSVPGELLPTIIKSFGWDAINPFSGSLDDWYSYSSVGSNRKKVAESTYRKILNNLLYIYKTKGTENSIRALLNCYGYPSDFIPIRLYGGTYEDLESDLVVLTGERQSPRNVTFDAEPIGVTNLIGNKSFEQVKDNHYSYNLTSKQLQFPWWKDDAKGDGIEFVFSGKPSINHQTLLISSGSGTRKLWNLSLKSTGTKTGRLIFSLSNDATGSSTLIASNTKQMSTDATTLKDGNLWNVYLTRNTNTASNALTQSYNLYAALQDGDKIPTVVSASMTISSSDNIAAYTGTGSYSGNRNLIVGDTFTGSLSEVRMWSGSLSASTFKMHVLDKHSVRGNSLLSSQNQLIYRFRLNENTPSGSVQTITDSSNPNNIKDFSFTDGNISSNFRYNKRVIDFVRYGIKTDPSSVSNNQRVNINDDEYHFYRNLNPNKNSVKDISSFDRRKSTSQIDIAVSSADSINKKILTEIGGFDITSKFATPIKINNTGSKYPDLESLRDSVLKNVNIDQNKFIRAYSNVFNNAVINNIKKVLPASSNLNTIGVVIKQDLLDRVKIQKGPHKKEIEHVQTTDAELTDMFNFDGSVVIRPISTILSASNDINLVGEISNNKFTGELSVVSSSLSITSNLPTIYSTNIDIVPSPLESEIVKAISNDLDIDVVSVSGNLSQQFETEITELTGSISSEYISPFETNINLTDGVNNLIFESSVFKPITGSIVNIASDSFNISSTLNDNLFSVNYNVLSSSMGISAETISHKSMNMNIIDDNLSLNSSEISFPVIGESIQLSNYLSEISSSHLQPFSFTLGSASLNPIVSSNINFPFTGDSVELSDYLTEITSSILMQFSDTIDTTEYLNLNSSVFSPIVSNDVKISNYLTEVTSSILPQFFDTIDTTEYLNLNSTFQDTINNVEYKAIDNSLNISSSITNQLMDTIDIMSVSYQLDANVLDTNDVNVNIFNYGAPRIIGKEYVRGYGYINHGKGLNDIWYMHMGSPGDSNDFNTAKYDDEYVHKAVGDVEIQSSSLSFVTGSEITTGSFLKMKKYEIDFTNPKTFLNRQIISGTNIQYKSFINGGDGIQHGTPVGRTTYFSASSDGTINYPINHEINFHNVKDQLRHLYYKKNNLPVDIIDKDSNNIIVGQQTGLGNFANNIDTIPTASVYKTEVVGTDVTRVEVKRLNKKK